MAEKINKLYLRDVLLIFSYILFLWIILTVGRDNIKLLTDDALVLVFMNAVWFVVLGFGTMSLMVVFLHLKKHKYRIYEEDITNGEKF